jgi:cyclohexyl-isocyanide hydratase
MLEYDPAPPFNAGSPDTAPPEVVQRITQRITSAAAGQSQRMAAVEQAAARLAASAG